MSANVSPHHYPQLQDTSMLMNVTNEMVPAQISKKKFCWLSSTVRTDIYFSNSSEAWFSLTKPILSLPLSLVCIHYRGKERSTQDLSQQKSISGSVSEGIAEGVCSVQVKTGKSGSPWLLRFISQTMSFLWLSLSCLWKKSSFMFNVMNRMCKPSQKPNR